MDPITLLIAAAAAGVISLITYFITSSKAKERARAYRDKVLQVLRNHEARVRLLQQKLEELIRARDAAQHRADAAESKAAQQHEAIGSLNETIGHLQAEIARLTAQVQKYTAETTVAEKLLRGALNPRQHGFVSLSAIAGSSVLMGHARRPEGALLALETDDVQAESATRELIHECERALRLLPA